MKKIWKTSLNEEIKLEYAVYLISLVFFLNP